MKFQENNFAFINTMIFRSIHIGDKSTYLKNYWYKLKKIKNTKSPIQLSLEINLQINRYFTVIRCC